MKIRFKKRISGLAKIAYITKEMEVETFQYIKRGDKVILPNGEERIAFCEGVKIPGHGTFELKPGSKIEIFNWIEGKYK